MPFGRTDIAIIGGGPAGSAAALSFRDRDPALTVALVEASHYDRPRPGEVLPAQALSVLDHLDVADAFHSEKFRQVPGAAISWGSPVLADHPYLFSVRGTGWHLDRTRFDAMLAREAERRGARLLTGSRLMFLEKTRVEWNLRLASGQTIHARYLIDTTGRHAALARWAGARVVPLDSLTGYVGYFDVEGDDDSRTMVEAAADGWWYSAALGDGTRVVAFMTDADIGRGLGSFEFESWRKLLHQTRFVSRTVEHALPRGELVVRPAHSRHLDPVCAEDWLAAGDAAACFDPVSAQGIIKAMRSGIFASYAAIGWLRGGDSAEVERYRSFVRQERTAFETARARLYAEEQRWRDRPFWQRRQMGATERQPKVLGAGGRHEEG